MMYNEHMLARPLRNNPPPTTNQGPQANKQCCYDQLKAGGGGGGVVTSFGRWRDATGAPTDERELSESLAVRKCTHTL